MLPCLVGVLRLFMGLPSFVGVSRWVEMDCGEAGNPESPRGLTKQRNAAPTMNSRHAPKMTIPVMKAASW